MPDPELVKTLDYILNRSNEASIEVIAEAVVRRRRDLSMYHAAGLSAVSMPDPSRMAKEIQEQINTGVGGGIDSMKRQIREMMVRIIRENAPELNESQIEELCRSWLPQSSETGVENGEKLPSDAIISMIEQFISFSHGTMKESVDKGLRGEMGDWTARYWKAFPPVIKQIITDYLKNKITGEEFSSKIEIALKL